MPFSLKTNPADVERLAYSLVQELSLETDVQILLGDGAYGLELERRFRLGWWTTGDEALRATLHRAKSRVYQHAKTAGTWRSLTEAWEVAEREIRSAPWRRHLQGLVQELPLSEASYLRLAFRAAQQAASRAARWRSALPDVPSPFDLLVALFARSAWPLGCHDGVLRVLLWSSRPVEPPGFGSLVSPNLNPEPEEDHRLFLSALFRDRALSSLWQAALENCGWRVIHGPVSEETRSPEVQLARRIRRAGAVLGLLEEADPDFGLPWWMFQELDYACACGQPVALIGSGHLAEPELPEVRRINASLEDPAEVLERHLIDSWFQSSRRKLAVALPALWLVLSCSLPLTAQLVSTATPEKALQAGVVEPPDASKLKLEKDKLAAELDKLQAERDKLQQEAQQLRETNAVIGKFTRFTTTWAAAIGSLFGALVTLVIGGIGIYFNSTQRKKLEQDKDLELKKHNLETRKLEQERAQERVKHLLEIFRDLGSEQARVRMGAVAILVQKIQKVLSGNAIDSDDKQDLPTIVSTLIIATKYEEKVEIQKQIADGLAQALEAVIPENQQEPSNPASPFARYDFQGARLENAWWKRVDARGVDFYKACLVRAGLREAFLSGAVLKKADLRNATLVKARLQKADLTGADLRGANLSNAVLTGAKLQGAKLDKTDLSGVDLTQVDLTGVDLRYAITDPKIPTL